MKVSITGIKELETQLLKLSKLDFQQVALDNVTQLFNRAAQKPYTPIDSGELRLSRATGRDSFGYVKEYAPHVEYGHRTKKKGFVKGQYFLKANIAVQQPIYKLDLLNKIKGL